MQLKTMSSAQSQNKVTVKMLKGCICGSFVGSDDMGYIVEYFQIGKCILNKKNVGSGEIRTGQGKGGAQTYKC